MLPRVLEPEVMDSIEEALDYDTMDNDQVNQRFVEDLITAGGDSQWTLDLGCGTALIPLLMAESLPAVRIVAVDYSANMLRVGRQHLVERSLLQAVVLIRADAKRLPFRDNTFPQVVSNSLIHHLREPQIAFHEAYRVTCPGGLLFFRDLARPTDEAALRQLVQLYAGGENPHQQQMLADSLRAALTLEEVAACLERLKLADSDLQMTSDRHWTWIARKA